MNWIDSHNEVEYEEICVCIADYGTRLSMCSFADVESIFYLTNYLEKKAALAA